MSVSRSKPRANEADETELRAFYSGCGFTAETIERAIRVRRGQPVEQKALVKAQRRRRPAGTSMSV